MALLLLGTRADMGTDMGRKSEFEKDLIPTYGEGYSHADMELDTVPQPTYPFHSSWSNPNRQPQMKAYKIKSFDGMVAERTRGLN